jgi:membrane dipeptidase
LRLDKKKREAAMQLDRRTVMTGGAAVAAIVATPAISRVRSAPGWYDRAIIIDALGGMSDPYGPDDQLRLSDRAWSEMVGTGVTS